MTTPPGAQERAAIEQAIDTLLNAVSDLETEDAGRAQERAVDTAREHLLACIADAIAQAAQGERERVETAIGALLGVVDSTLEYGLDDERLRRAYDYAITALRARPGEGTSSRPRSPDA